MPLIVSSPEREFKFKDEVLPDPDPNLSPVDVLDFYSSKYPELTTGYCEEPELDEASGKLTYEVKFSVGSKA